MLPPWRKQSRPGGTKRHGCACASCAVFYGQAGPPGHQPRCLGGNPPAPHPAPGSRRPKGTAGRRSFKKNPPPAPSSFFKKEKEEAAKTDSYPEPVFKAQNKNFFSLRPSSRPSDARNLGGGISFLKGRRPLLPCGQWGPLAAG